jgi:hypothetical protein
MLQKHACADNVCAAASNRLSRDLVEARWHNPVLLCASNVCADASNKLSSTNRRANNGSC